MEQERRQDKLTRQQVDIAVMKDKITNLENRLEKIETNHLPHIQDAVNEVRDAVNELKVTIARWGGGISVGIAILEFVSRFYSK